MSEKNYSIKHLAVSFLCGSVFFSGVALAAGDKIEANLDRVSLFVQGENKSSADGLYDNGGTQVPESLDYRGTTYVPVRMVSSLLGQPVYWEGNGRSVSIGAPTATFVDAKGQTIGSAVLKQQANGVEITVKVSGLTPGKHGIHIHESAFAGSNFKMADGHFNPEVKKHGLLNPEGHHLGDLPNLVVGENGTAEATFLVENATLEPGKTDSLLGRSIIIHAGEDDEMTDPAGNSGDRVAGANIPM
ncbi:superoxide dismutase family protein [Paenibacillus sp. sptzw28]|uniref:superoxide dismutase family protein n=1 Tax=Paenibacillus sp. sptzw28 TaxID=715179 RepID=UPI001C6E7E39|nr:superoxide dismutase family protein [Paenibacillus sp. sptzw28]QYR22512.1 superoxide dismutase family protein [Paenibacillus sp. sptzw28]